MRVIKSNEPVRPWRRQMVEQRSAMTRRQEAVLNQALDVLVELGDLDMGTQLRLYIQNRQREDFQLGRREHPYDRS